MSSAADENLPTHNLPVVAVADDKFYSGANEISGDGAPALTILSFEDAFTSPFSTDAHFVSYQPLFTGLDAWPRLNKPILSKLRERGCDVVSNMLVLDYDNPGHKPWEAEGVNSWSFFLSKLMDLADSWPLAWDWSLLYGTKNGARLVYVLDKPVPVDAFELKSIWMCQQFTERGLYIPEECCDWTRLFRLPFVMRENVKTWEEPYADQLHQFEKRLAVERVGDGVRRGKGVQEYGEIKPITDDKPDDNCAEELMFTVGPSGRRHHSEFWKEARRRLRGRDCAPCIFDNVPLAKEGARNQTIMRYVGQAITMLIRVPACTPAHIYGLFLSAVQQLEPDAGTRDWTDILWDAVCRLWSREEAKVEVEIKKEEARAQAAKGALDVIIEGMQKWCHADQLWSDNAEIRQKWASQHLIISTGRNFMIVKPDGTYDPMQVTQTQLIARLNILGLGGTLVQTHIQGENGGLRPVPVQQIINEHCTIVSKIRAVPEIEGAYIEDIDKDTAQVVIPTYRRTKNIEAKYNPEVDTWLHKLFGANYDIAVKWIGWALAWDEGPICALSIAGKAGSGKKMLAQGLSECLQLPKLAGTDDLVGNYGYGLFESPFLVVNEGWPGSFNGMHPADKFRALVSGDLPPIRKMYQDPINVKSPVRILFTANNLEVIKMLSANKDLSPDDRDALSIRLLHFSITEEASDWLKLKGGNALTAMPGQRWIAGDAGEPSDFVVAKHFMYLYINRKRPTGARFLVEGNHAQQIMFDMRTGSGNTPLVIETIIRLLETPSREKGIAIEHGELYVLHDAILRFFREELALSVRQALTGGTITNVLKGLVKVEVKGAITLDCRKEMGRKYWQQLDARLLLKVAQRDGMTSAKLEALVAEQDARARGEDITPMVYEAPATKQAANVVNFTSVFEKKKEQA